MEVRKNTNILKSQAIFSQNPLPSLHILVHITGTTVVQISFSQDMIKHRCSRWKFVIPWPTKIAVTCSIFDIEGSFFGFSLIFVCSKDPFLQLKVSDQFFNDLIFYTPLPKGGRIKNLNSNLVQNFCFKYLGKVKKLWFNIHMRLKAINENA